MLCFCLFICVTFQFVSKLKENYSNENCLCACPRGKLGILIHFKTKTFAYFVERQTVWSYVICFDDRVFTVKFRTNFD